ncbi:MAG TPA: RodZ domain-containing protein [Verrucomicrobiae bacterium]|nr:RodZ domain-containing protein [Verrucomicrobiae bacterium]
MSSTPFGEHLKREREMRGVSLNEISAATRISTRFLEAIENDRWNELPGGAFNRGFIRSIARYLGLDEDSIVAEYSLDTSGSANVREAAQFVKTGRNWRPVVVAAVMLLALLGAGLLVHHFFGSRIVAMLHGRQSLTTSAARSRPASPDIQPSVPNQTKAQPGPGSADSQESDPAPEGTLALSIRTEKPGYLKVVTDGQTVLHERVRAGYSHNFQARNAFEIFSSRASGVRLSLNGQNVPFPPTPGRMARIELSKNDLRSSGGVH